MCDAVTSSYQEQKPGDVAAFQKKTGNPSGGTDSLLMFAYYYPPENASGAQRATRFVKYLRKQGYRTEVITRGKAEGPQSSDHVYRTATPGGGAGTFKAAGTFFRFVERTILPYRDQLPWMPTAIATARRVMQEHPTSAVFSTSPPLGAHLAAAWIKHEFGIPWIADFRDPVCGNPFRTRWWGKPYDAVLENVIIRYADAVIANTNTSVEMLRRRYPGMAHKVHLIWNGFDPEEPMEALPVASRTHKVLLHAGGIYGGRHPKLLLQSLNRMISTGSINAGKLRVRLIGEMDDYAWFERSNFQALVAQGWVEYENRRFPLEDARREIAQADYLLLLDLNELGTGLQVPAKLFEYIRIGRPILAFTARDSASSHILAKSSIPHTCVYTNDTDSDIDRKMSEFLSYGTQPVAPSEWFQRNFNAVAQTRILTELLASLPLL
jgi:glycosyltransferase involved in cell wall biosynthesis